VEVVVPGVSLRQFGVEVDVVQRLITTEFIEIEKDFLAEPSATIG
jgi:hypothetical protein